MNIRAYHGTELENAKRIQKDGFEIHKNPSHWLGNGVYFFKDYSLALWWAKSAPTNKFGTEIVNPVVMHCDITVDEKKLLDLLKLDDYLEFINTFDNEFINEYCASHPVYAADMWRLRCAYCDFLEERYYMDVLIGSFVKPAMSYLPIPKNHNPKFDEFLLRYVETQVCVFNPGIIQVLKAEEV